MTQPSPEITHRNSNIPTDHAHSSPHQIYNRQNAGDCANSAQAVINAATVAASRSIQQAEATAAQAIMQASISASAAIGQASAEASKSIADISKTSLMAASQASSTVASLMVSAGQSGGGNSGKFGGGGRWGSWSWSAVRKSKREADNMPGFCFKCYPIRPVCGECIW